MTERARVVRVRKHGGPQVLSLEQVELEPPGPGEVRVVHTAIGLNYIDVYFRTGLYPVPELPFVPGLEAAGVVEALGEGVEGLAVGDRVAYASRPLGAYCDARNYPAERLVRLPDGISDEDAAALMLKGMTAEYLLRRTVSVEAGDAILVHAAAGGVGTLLCQWGAHLSATVIGTVGSEEKAEEARASGCTHVVHYRDENVAERVKALTDGAGVRVVYDSVGRDTLESSLDSLAPRGTLVAFGQSSGPPAPIELSELASRGSLFVTRPSLFDYIATRDELLASAASLFEVVGAGAVKAHIGQRYPLGDVAEAHTALERRATRGATLLAPG